ncbi:MAG: peptidylprolyl isomerase [Hydrogenophilales bacterium]|nr:peptidylprolyl isomerase [Hydrogenophilales bacterium]
MKKNWLVCGMLTLCLSGVARAETSDMKAASAAPTDTRVLLEWDDMKVTELDFESDVRRIPEVNRYEFRQSGKRINDLLQSLMMNRSLAALARKAGIDQDPLVQREIEIAKERLLASKYILAYQAKLVMPDFDGLAREYYQVHQTEFQLPESVRASHILIDVKKRSDEEAKRLAQEVKAKLAAGADFAQMVKEYSDDPTAKGNGGSLGSFGKVAWSRSSKRRPSP